MNPQWSSFSIFESWIIVIPLILNNSYTISIYRYSESFIFFARCTIMSKYTLYIFGLFLYALIIWWRVFSIVFENWTFIWLFVSFVCFVNLFASWNSIFVNQIFLYLIPGFCCMLYELVCFIKFYHSTSSSNSFQYLNTLDGVDDRRERQPEEDQAKPPLPPVYSITS